LSFKAIIFDLDLTLIASEKADSLRKARKWPQVYGMIPDLLPYKNIDLLFDSLDGWGVKKAIVTSSPRPYCEKIIRQWGWKFETEVCFHDTTNRKPHPDPMLKALSNLQLKPAEVISIGDDPKDIESSRGAGIPSVGALWGALDRSALIQQKPNHTCDSVEKFLAYLKEVRGE
jgi:phosphoglycolate phosphatase-like HAD superfamily hydrolase